MSNHYILYEIQMHSNKLEVPLIVIGYLVFYLNIRLISMV